LFWVKLVFLLICAAVAAIAQLRQFDLETQVKNVLPLTLSPSGHATFMLSEEFASGVTGSGDFGSLGWLSSLGTGGAVNSTEGVGADHPGAIRLSSGTTSGNQTVLHLGTATGNVVDPSVTLDSTWIFLTNHAFPLTNAQWRMGLGAAVTGATPTDGLYFEKLSGDTNWFAVCRASSTETRVDTGEAAGSSWLRFRIRRVNGTTFGFTAANQTEVTCTANIPTTDLSVFAASKTADTVNKLLEIDYMSVTFPVTR
jgi:hypothetical protein